MDNASWLTRWQDGRIGFHQPDGHPALAAYWNWLDPDSHEPVLVPLCGKARDMASLAGHGHAVYGVELSERAARDFFAESDVSPTIFETRGSKRFQGDWAGGGSVTIDVADFFERAGISWPCCGLFFDRAALIALPASMRPRYVKHLIEALSTKARGLLITLDYPSGQMTGPPFSVGNDEVHALYGHAFTVTQLASRDALADNDHLQASGVSRLTEHTYLLQRRE